MALVGPTDQGDELLSAIEFDRDALTVRRSGGADGLGERRRDPFEVGCG